MITFRVVSNIGIAIRARATAMPFFFFFSLFISFPLYAQWTAIAPSLLGVQGIETGAITHKSGITWAGSLKSVFMSPDSGITWLDRSPQILSKTDNIDDIFFFDNKTGLVCTNLGSVFRTDDQGLNWREIHRAQYAYSVAFLGSTDNIIVTSGPGGTIEVSLDGGITWQQPYTPGGGVPQVRPLLGGGAMVLAGILPGGQYHILRTNDYGITWQQMPGVTDFDTYSFDVNPCDPRFIYIANEKGTISGNNQSILFTSNDAGNSWTKSQSFPRLYYSGSVALTTKAVLVQTVNNGIQRSTDQGASWKGIGGPSATWDTRLLCAINSNIILAADNNGTIWRTKNSGGDSILNISPFESLSLNPDELFTTDTLVSCDSPVVDIFHLRGILCSYPKIIGQKITGVDSLDYRIVQPVGDSLSGNDSAFISFRPRGSGAQSGEYIITLEDSTQISVPLKGFGKNIIFVQPMTADIAVDTIGGYAQVPLRFSGFPQKEDLEVVLHYDTRMIYNGSNSILGASFDLPGESWQGRSKIRIPKSELQLDTISGLAIFTVFPNGTDCFKVSLDSMNILSLFAPCTYSIGGPATAMICPLKGCGVMTLTNYLRHGTLPQLSIIPNPNQGTAFITSSETLGYATVEIIDILGRIYGVRNISFQKGMPVTLELDNLRSGSYYLNIRTAGSLYQVPIAIIH